MYCLNISWERWWIFSLHGLGSQSYLAPITTAGQQLNCTLDCIFCGGEFVLSSHTSSRYDIDVNMFKKTRLVYVLSNILFVAVSVFSSCILLSVQSITFRVILHRSS